MVRPGYELWPSRLLRLWPRLPFLGFDQGPKPPVERGDALSRPGDVDVDDGFRRNLGQDAFVVDELVPFPLESEGGPIVRGPLEFGG